MSVPVGHSRQQNQRTHSSHLHSQTNVSETYNSFYNESNKDLDEISYDMVELKRKQKKSESSSNVYFDFTEVFVWGDDSFGQLGLYHQKLKKGNKDQTSFKLPKTCSFNILIRQVSCGENHSSILTSQGHLYMMGSNSEGQLGIGDNCPDFHIEKCAGAPCLVDILRDMKVEKVECGRNFTIALVQGSNSHLQVYAWGSNKFGQLGLFGCDQVDTPVKVSFFEGQRVHVSDVSCGREHTLFITEKNLVYGCGSNSQGQIGLDLNSQQMKISQPTIIEALEDQIIVQAKAGQNHSIFLNEDGEVFTCGSNNKYQLGVGEGSVARVPVSVPALANYKVAKVEAYNHSAAVTSNGELFLWGTGVFGQYKTPQKILTISNQVKDISLGETLGAAVDTKGLLWTWGTNHSGELGVGDHEPRVHPYPVLTLKGKLVTSIACGGSFVIALGSNLKKELPGLKLKKTKEATMTKNRGASSSKSKTRSLSKSKKKNSSASNLFQRKDSNSSIGRIYIGGGSAVNLDPKSPKAQQNRQSKILQKRHSKSSLHKSTKVNTSDIPKVHNIKVKKRVSKISEEGTTTGGTASLILNQSQIILNKNGSFVQSPVNAKKVNLNSSQVDIHTNDSSQAMHLVSSLTNKEKFIKDLQGENKSLKSEQELQRKENRQLKNQIEQLEKQIERSKTNHQHEAEIRNLQNELKKKDQKISDLKSKKVELKKVLQTELDDIENQRQEIDQLKEEKQSLESQVKDLSLRYQELQSKLAESEKKNANYESEIKEFENEVQLLRDHSKEVEKQLIDKLHEISEKYKDIYREKEEMQGTLRDAKKRCQEAEYNFKDREVYMGALERENLYLRDEIERAKFSKDKEEYGRFVSGLTQIRKKNGQQQQLFDKENNESQNYVPSIVKQPFAEVSQNHFNDTHKKKIDFDKDNSEQSMKGNTQEIEISELKMSYNQRLLKSIEKKTMKENYLQSSAVSSKFK